MRNNTKFWLSLLAALVILSGAVVYTSATPAAATATATATQHVFKKVIYLGNGQNQDLPSYQEFTVPAGQRIVLEFVAARGCVAPGATPELLIFENAPVSGGSLGAYRFGSTEPVNGMGGMQCFAFHQQMTAYLDPGSLVTVAFNGTALDTTYFEVTLSGEVLNVK